MFASACSFHRSVQCEQIGLESNFINQADDVGNLAARAIDLAHCRDRLCGHFTAALGLFTGTAGQLVGMAGVFRVLFHGGGHFLHRGRGLFEARGLLLRTLAQVVVATGNLLRSGADFVRTMPNFADDRDQALVHRAECFQQATEFVLATDHDIVPELAVRNFVGHRHRIVQRLGDRADQYRGHHQREQQPDRQCAEAEHPDTLVVGDLGLEDRLGFRALRFDQFAQRFLALHQQRTHFHFQRIGDRWITLLERVQHIVLGLVEILIGRKIRFVSRCDSGAHRQRRKALLQIVEVGLIAIVLGKLLLHLIGLAYHTRRLAQHDERLQRVGADVADHLRRHHLFFIDMASAFVLKGHRSQTDGGAAKQHGTKHRDQSDQPRANGERGELKFE